MSCLSKRYPWRVFWHIVDCRIFSKSTKHKRYYLPVDVVLRIKRICWNPGYGRKMSKIKQINTIDLTLCRIIWNTVDVNAVFSIIRNMEQRNRWLWLIVGRYFGRILLRIIWPHTFISGIGIHERLAIYYKETITN